MIDNHVLLVLIKKELRDAQRNRWFWLFALAFAGLSLGLASVAMSSSGRYGLASFNRISASLVNLVMLIVPLMGLVLGALSLAGEREQGTLLYLLANPITHAELILGKFIGLSLGLMMALTLGFGLTGGLIFAYGQNVDSSSYFILVGLTILLAMVSLSLGMLISLLSGRGLTAVGGALFVWFILLILGDLGLIGSALMLDLDIHQTMVIAFSNPVQLFKLAALWNVRQNLDVLGPVGIYAVRSYGSSLWLILTALLLIWIAVPLSLTTYLSKRRGAL